MSRETGDEQGAPYPYSEEVELSGHIIDSLMLPKVWDTIMDMGGNFNLEKITVGRTKTEVSYARLKVFAPEQELLEQILYQIQEHGATLVNEKDVSVEPVVQNGVLPDDFYSTTNLPTKVRLDGKWINVEGLEMDVAIVIDRAAHRAYGKPMNQVKVGEQVAVGHEGISVVPLERARDREVFSFMQSAVSSEKAKRQIIRDVARTMVEIRAHGGKILFVLGPAVVHTDAINDMTRLIRKGYVQVIFGGNAIATHDVENALYGTSLGVQMESGLSLEGGHRNHLRALNTIRRAGSLVQAVDQGILKKGIMYECIKHNVKLVLAGSIRDDGPMPDVINDMQVAQQRMREEVGGVELAIMISSMLHSIATGNLLPARVRTVVVDINPAVVTKLADRGSFQALGLVTDAELFLRELTLSLNDVE